jgi:MFS family permease
VNVPTDTHPARASDRTRFVDASWYGWVVVGAAFLFLALTTGFGFYSLSTYAGWLGDERGLTISATSLASTGFMLSSGVGGMGVAWLLARRDIRLVLCGGTLVMMLTLPLVPMVDSAWQLCAVYFVWGLGTAAVSMIPASTLVMQWFDGSPAKAMAIATTGMSVGGALVAPLVATWVSRSGLPSATVGMTVLLGVLLLPLSILVIRPRPVAAAVPAALALIGRPAPLEGRGRAVSTLLTIAFSLLLLSQVATITHLLTLAAERDLSQGALALSLVAGTSVVGRLVGIPLVSRIGVGPMSVGNAALQAAAMTTLGLATDSLGLLMGAALLGATVGNTVVLLPLTVLEVFGRDDYTPRYARANLWTGFGTALGPFALGFLHDATGGYRWSMVLLGGGSAVAAILLPVAHRLRRLPPA